MGRPASAPRGKALGSLRSLAEGKAAACAALALAALSGACDKADFKSSTAKVTTPKTALSGCDSLDEAKGIVDVGIDGAKDQELVLTGEFCPRVPAEVRILFLVDFSISMYHAAKNTGNDPPLNGGCGRLAAAKTLVERHTQQLAGQSSNLKVGVMKFSSGIDGTLPFDAPASFGSVATVENFCLGAGGTNYKAAFDGALAFLQNEPGTKIIYFISDGLPTEGGGGLRMNAPRHRDAALASLAALRAAVPALTFNTVFLGNVHDIQEENFDPEAFLVQLTGDPARVKFVDKAENLAQAVVTLEPPKVVIDMDTAKARLFAGSDADGKTIGFDFFKQREGEPIWDFRTEPFDPFPGGAGDSRLVVSAQGDTAAANFEIVYNLKSEEE
jgi:hypothetical protein